MKRTLTPPGGADGGRRIGGFASGLLVLLAVTVTSGHASLHFGQRAPGT